MTPSCRWGTHVNRLQNARRESSVNRGGGRISVILFDGGDKVRRVVQIVRDPWNSRSVWSAPACWRCRAGTNGKSRAATIQSGSKLPALQTLRDKLRVFLVWVTCP